MHSDVFTVCNTSWFIRAAPVNDTGGRQASTRKVQLAGRVQNETNTMINLASRKWTTNHGQDELFVCCVERHLRFIHNIMLVANLSVNKA